MKKIIKQIVFITLLCIALLILVEVMLTDYSENANQTKLEFIISGCNEENARSTSKPPTLTINQKTIELQHDAYYSCCAKISVDLKRDGKQLILTEVNNGEVCRCMCNYFIEAKISNLLPNEYEVILFNANNEQILNEKIIIE